MIPKTIKAETLESAFVLLGEAHANGASPVPCVALSQGGPASPCFSRMAVVSAIETVAALERIERSLRRIALRACNVPLSEAETALNEKREARLYTKANAIAAAWGVRLLLGGDVRGSQVRFQCPRTGRSNTFGGASSGWAL